MISDSWAEWIDKVVTRRYERTGEKARVIEVDFPTYASILKDELPMSVRSQHKIGVYTGSVDIDVSYGGVVVIWPIDDCWRKK